MAAKSSSFQLYLIGREEVPQAHLITELPRAPANYATGGAAWSRDSRFVYYSVFSDSDAGGNSAIFAIDSSRAYQPILLTNDQTKGVAAGIAWQP